MLKGVSLVQVSARAEVNKSMNEPIWDNYQDGARLGWACGHAIDAFLTHETMDRMLENRENSAKVISELTDFFWKLAKDKQREIILARKKALSMQGMNAKERAEKTDDFVGTDEMH